MNRRCFIQMGCYILVCLFLTISTASARVCFLPDSTDCGSSDVNIPDVPCKYYNCKEAGLKNEAYQTCYDERTYNNGGVNVNCKQVKCNISKSDCEAQAKATSQSCKFDDASGCYYLGECKQCNKDLYDLKEPKSGSDWECDSCTGCDGTFYSCTAKEKECKDINSSYTLSCSDSQTAEEVKGVKDSKGNQCYTCKSKPIDKCVDIEATPFLDIIEPTVKTVKASGEVKEVNATLECGINPKKAYKYEINISNNYDYINLPVKRIKPVEYRYYASGSLPGYYYKTNIDGKNVCITDRLCTQYAKDGEYISAYEISINTGARLDHKIYCCKTDDNFSGDSLRNLYSSCKEAQPIFESQHIDRYIKPFYVCDKGVKEGTKCKIGSYSCPKDYKLSGDNCVKKECPKGYFLTSDNGKDVCVNPTYTCPTDGKYKYKLSGDKCVCDNSKTCSEIDKTYIETSSIKDNDPEDICPYLYSPVFGYVKNLGNGNTDLKIGFKFGGGDNAEFADTSVVGCTACRWKTCEEIDSDFGNDPDLLNCEQGYAPEIVKADWAVGSDGRCYECITKDFRIDTKRSDCHGVYIKHVTGYETSTGSKINQYYLLPKGSKVYVGVWKLSDTKLCQNADYTLYIDGKKFSAKNDEFTLDDDFIKKYNIDRNAFTIRAEDKINIQTYTAELYLDNDDCPYGEGICPSAGIVVDDASDDEYMKDVTVDTNVSIGCCGYKDGCGSPYPNIVFDGKSWWNYHYTTSEQCYYTLGTSSEFNIYKRSEGKYIATIKGFGCTKVNDGTIEICIKQH